MLEVRLFGTFAIQYGGNPVVLSSRAAQSLFAYLILTAGTKHRREKLAGMFWPDSSDEKARTYLRQQLWRIRKALTPKTTVDYLIADDFTVSFNSSTDYWLDVNELRKVLENPATRDLENALSVYQGEFLPGFYEEWITEEREHLHGLFEQKIGMLLEQLALEKRWHEVLEWSERWISLGEGPETAYRHLMIAYDALGDRARVASTYERCIQALGEMDLEPSEETRALAFKRNPRLSVPIPLTSFIGREKELKEVAGLLSKSRLVTLTGAGGAGKTRLAVQVVPDVLELFPDGIRFLDLAPLSDPQLVSYTLANLLGLRETGSSELSINDQLIDFFHSRVALVVFDNCEHLIESCAKLASSLLASCPGLSILATSREALRISGEVPYRVPSLSIPNLDLKPGREALESSEAVRLFIERAVVASPGFRIDQDSIVTVANICQRLDGIPLAIELAAARVTVLSAGQILKRLDDRFELLKGGLRSSLPRQQTLRATIEWSYDLLPEKECILFRRLAVFAGSWSLEAAEKVCGGNGIESGEILDLMDQLINKSLVIAEAIVVPDTTGSSMRYRCLETIRQFASEKLFETADAARLQERHFTFFLRKAEEIEPLLIGAEQPIWVEYLDTELDNFRLALEWSISKMRGEEALRLFGALGWFWVIRCHFMEGADWFRRALKLRDTVSKIVQIKALRHAGSLYFNQEDFSEARSVLLESLNLCREIGDLKEISTGLQFLGVLETGSGGYGRARRLLEESLTISRSINNQPAITRALLNLANISQKEGDYPTASMQYEEGLKICREMQDSHLTALVLGSMGDLAFAQKNYAGARESYGEALRLCLKIKNKRTIVEYLLSFAEVLCAEVHYAQSAQLEGFVSTMLNERGVIFKKNTLTKIEMIAEILKTHLGDEAFYREFSAGKSLQLDQAVEIALNK
jgi:predicted ATPase/DNA-binding SARP family transcriptional activator